MMAVQNRKKTMVDLLLARGADPNLVNSEGKTALIIAVEQFGTNVAT